MWVASLYVLGLYRLRSHWTLRREMGDVVRATLLLVEVSLGALYILKLTDVSRLFLLMLWAAQPAVPSSPARPSGWLYVRCAPGAI